MIPCTSELPRSGHQDLEYLRRRERREDPTGTKTLFEIESLKDIIERLVAGGRLGPEEQHALEDALAEAWEVEKDLIASLEALRAAQRTKVDRASSEGIVHHFYLVPEDEGRSTSRHRGRTRKDVREYISV